MKKNSLFLFFSFILILSAKSQQEFRFGYIFKKSKFQSPNLTMLNDITNVDVITGYVLQPDGSRFPVHQIIGLPHVQRNIYKRLKGIIDFRAGDTLYLHFWKISKDPTNLAANDVSQADNDKNFTYCINWGTNRSFRIPFSYRIVTATAIPFRYNFVDKTTTGEFANFNIAYFFVRGATKIYHNEDLKPRSHYFGIGPFVGATTIDDPSQSSNQFGMTYGVSTVFTIFGLNLVESFGFENGFKSGTSKAHGYIGFGIGYSLVSLFDPSN